MAVGLMYHTYMDITAAIEFTNIEYYDAILSSNHPHHDYNDVLSPNVSHTQQLPRKNLSPFVRICQRSFRLNQYHSRLGDSLK